MTFLIIGIIAFAVALFALGFCKDGDGFKWRKNKKQFISVLALLIILFGCTASVPTGHTGVVTTFGRVEDFTLEAGFHFKLPWQQVVNMDNRTQKASVNLTCFSSDIQEVTMVYSINFQIEKSNAQTIYKTIGTGYYDTIVAPRIEEAVKSVAAQYTAEGLVSHRDEMGDKIKEKLIAELHEYNIELVNTAIENLDFTDEFTDAVEAKQVAEQNKIKAKTEAEQRVIEAEAAAEVKKVEAQAQAEAELIEAEATAEANRLLSESLTAEVLKNKFYEKWNGVLPSVMGNNSVITDISGE